MKKSLWIIGGFAVAAIICIMSVKLWGPDNAVERVAETAVAGATVIV